MSGDRAAGRLDPLRRPDTPDRSMILLPWLLHARRRSARIDAPRVCEYGLGSARMIVHAGRSIIPPRSRGAGTVLPAVELRVADARLRPVRRLLRRSGRLPAEHIRYTDRRHADRTRRSTREARRVFLGRRRARGVRAPRARLAPVPQFRAPALGDHRAVGARCGDRRMARWRSRRRRRLARPRHRG